MRRLAVLEDQFRTFSPGERLILYIFSALLAISSFALVVEANSLVSVTVPSRGGTLTEGVVGPARFINPLISLSQPDEDIAALVYSGLMRARPDGTLVPDLAEKYEISEDGLNYTFTLREGLTFHDGAPITSADILFTIQKAKDPDIKSTKRADWEGVTVAAPDPKTVVFTLPRAYAPFLENTTLGILPRHLWEGVSAGDFHFTPLNTHPVGSGPYRVSELDTSNTGAPIRYELQSFNDFALGEPNIRRINFFFYPNEEALINAYNAGHIDSFAAVSPERVADLRTEDTSLVRVALPRTFGVFFNQGKNAALADPAVRNALASAVDKQSIVESVLHGYGRPLSGPIPPGVLGVFAPATPTPLVDMAPATSTGANFEEARNILVSGGWKFDEAEHVWKKGTTRLEFTLASADAPELAATAEQLASVWRSFGVVVNVHVYSLSELNQTVIRPRNYEAVLFGEVVGRTLDLFAFWHSSQRNDPGLNLSLYTNAQVDALLASARTQTDANQRKQLYDQFTAIIDRDKPAIFLYAPEFLYVVPEGIGGVQLGALTTPSERFLNVQEWYTDTERVWTIFANK